jgi:methionine-rich copper-binding protein CopC
MNTVTKTALSVVLATLVISAASASYAHTDTFNTSPANGDSVTAGVQQIAVEFNDKILDLADSSEIVITGPNDQAVEVSCIAVEAKSLTVDAMIPAEGNYKVTWRTVAEDGHPISGKFSFAATGSSDEDFTSCTEASARTTIEEPMVVASPEPAKDSGDLTIYLVGGAVVLAAGIALVIRGRRKPKA